MNLLDPMITNKDIDINSPDFIEEEDDDYDDEGIYPIKISTFHAMIYDWVCDWYGSGEADNPSWDINALSKYLHKVIGRPYEQENTIYYTRESFEYTQKDFERDEEDEDEE